MPKRGQPATASQRAALERGQQAKRDKAAEAKEQGRDRAGVRWQKLLDGTLSVSDLDNEELKRMKVRGADGSFSGHRPTLPSHIAMAMRNEWLKRGNRKLEKAYHDMIDVLTEIATDPDSREGDRVRAANIVIERVGGKVPETIRVEREDDPWAATLREALVDDRDMDGFAAESSD